MTQQYTTRRAAEREDGELYSVIQRAVFIFQNTGDVALVDLAGFALKRTQRNTWQVWTHEDDHEDAGESELVDEFDPRQFRSAHAILVYLYSFERTGEDDDLDEEFEPNHGRPGVV